MSSDTVSPSPTPQTPPQDAGAAPWARLAIEAGPLAVFFIINSLQGIMWGTAAFMVATSVSVVLSIRLEKRWPIMPIVSCFFVLLFGGLTLVLNDDLFIKLKPTIVNLLFAAVLFVGLVLRRQVLKVLLGTLMELTDIGWRLLTWRWAVFFVLLAALNEIVWRTMSTDFWVSFKLFGILPLTLAFSAAQIPLLLKHQPVPATAKPIDGQAGTR